MIDGVLLENGQSRAMRATLPATYEEFVQACANGTQLLDIMFNAAGWQTQPTFLNAGNLLSNESANALGLPNTAVPDDAWSKIVPAGSVFWIASTTIPSSFLMCDGSSLSTTDYAALFSAIGYTFGGSGTQFNLPDLRAAFIRGAGTQNGYSATFGQSQEASAISTVFTSGQYKKVQIINQDKSVSDLNKSAGQNGLSDGGQYMYVRPFNLALTPIIKY